MLDEIEIKLDGMTDAQRNKALDNLGGSFGKVALSALLSGESLEEVQRLMNQQASATEVADARMKSLIRICILSHRLNPPMGFVGS